MLRFTPEQSRVIVNQRRNFAAQQNFLNNQFGLASENVPMSQIGNALSLPRDVWGRWGS
jgi:hypothetical protein